MKYSVLILMLFTVFSCSNKKKSTELVAHEEVEINKEKQDINLEVYDFRGFQNFLKIKDEKTYVINFWATWCAPCVKELPYFERINQEYKSKDVEVILVSLDFPHLYDSKLKPYILKKGLKSKVIALNDPNENKWISEIDKSWSGSIPATIIYNKEKSKFFERSFTYEELVTELKQF